MRYHHMITDFPLEGISIVSLKFQNHISNEKIRLQADRQEP